MILNEICIFVSLQIADLDLNKWYNVTHIIGERYRIGFKIIPTIVELTRQERIPSSYVSWRIMGPIIHDFFVLDQDGEEHYKAPITLDKYLYWESDILIRKEEKLKIYTNKEIINKIHMESLKLKSFRAAKKLGAEKGFLLAHTNSNEIMLERMGTTSSDSVGYAAIVF